MSSVHLTINGQAEALEIDPRQSLLDVLRERLDLTGTKKGCNQGACGACTILVDGKRVVSCLTLALMHDGAEITTIEGLAKERNFIHCRRPSSSMKASSADSARPVRSCPGSAVSRGPCRLAR